MKKIIVFCLLLAALAVFTVLSVDDIKPKIESSEAASKKLINVNVQEPQDVFVPSFSILPIDQKIEKRISGISWKQGSPVELKDLSYLQVTYWGFDEKPHIGELIVNKNIAEEVIEIFKELYAAKFPIEKIRLIDEYNADDSKSMKDNNTSAFNYREVAGKSGELSKHSYGLAIDINPVQNPYVYKGKVTPDAGTEYIDRTKASKGIIVKGDACYKAFTKRGWIWGGDWKYEKDYQHFQKKLDNGK